jgi:drug/metabolite transporter (DMT)-like permease
VWVASLVALLSITFGTIYQKRFGGGIDWRAGMLLQYTAAGILFALGAMAFETRIVHWMPEFLFAWLVIVLSFGAIRLLYFLISRAAATRIVSLFYLTLPMMALMAWASMSDGDGSARCHGPLRYRRISGELANSRQIAACSASRRPVSV